MIFLLILTFQGVFSYSHYDLYRVPLVYNVLAPVYVKAVDSPFIRCLETARGLGIPYPVLTCWNELLKYKQLQRYTGSILLAHPPANSPSSYNTLPLTGPIAYGQSSSWAGSYGNPSLVGGVSASAHASASASAGGLTVSSGSSSSANASSSTSTGNYGYKPDVTSSVGSSLGSTGPAGYYVGYYTGAGDGSTLTSRPTSTKPTCSGYSSNYYLQRPSTGSVSNGIYYNGYNLPISTNTGVTSGTVGSTSSTGHPPGYYTAFYKPSGVSTVSSGGHDGHYNTYYYQPISPTTVVGSGSGSSTLSGTHYIGPGSYYSGYYKPTGTVNVGSTTGTNPSVGSGYTSSTEGTSVSKPSYSGSQSNSHLTSVMQPSYGNNRPQTVTNLTNVVPTAVSKPWWLINGVFAASLASSLTLGFPNQVIVPDNGTVSSSWSNSTGGVLASSGNVSSGTFNSSNLVGSSAVTTSASGTSSSSAIASNVSVGNAESGAAVTGLGSESTWSSSSSGSGSTSVSSSTISQVSSISNSISSSENTYGSTSSNMSEVETTTNLGSSSVGSITTTHIPWPGTSSTAMSFTNNILQSTTPKPIATSTIENVPWWVSSGVPGISSIFGSAVGIGSSSSISSSNIVSPSEANSGSTVSAGSVNGPPSTTAGINMTVDHEPTTESTSSQIGSTTNTGGPWWLSGGSFGGSGAGSIVTSGSSIGSSTSTLTESEGSSSTHTGSTGNSSVHNGVGSSSVSSSGSGSSSGPWWLTGSSSFGGGGSIITNATGSSMGSTVGSPGSTISIKPGNNTVFPVESNGQQSIYNSSGAPIYGIGSSILNHVGSISSQGASTGPSIPSSNFIGQSQTAGTGLGASSVSTSASSTGSEMLSLPGAPNLPFPFSGGQSGVQSVLGTSASSSATASASSGSITNPTNIGGFPGSSNQPWWQSGGLPGLGSSPYLKSSEESIENINITSVSKQITDTVSPTKSIEPTSFSLS